MPELGDCHARTWTHEIIDVIGKYSKSFRIDVSLEASSHVISVIADAFWFAVSGAIEEESGRLNGPRCYNNIPCSDIVTSNGPIGESGNKPDSDDSSDVVGK